MAYEITEIEGIGPKFAEKLSAAGIASAEDLLARARTPAGRKSLADAAEIRPDLILTWANRADLMRLKGVGGQYAELLNVAGVDTIKELRRRNAANLRTKMVEINDERNICKNNPSETMVEGWIAQAATLDGALEY